MCAVFCLFQGSIGFGSSMSSQVDWDRERGEKEGVPSGVKISLKACDEAQQSAYFFDMLDTLNES